METHGLGITIPRGQDFFLNSIEFLDMYVIYGNLQIEKQRVVLHEN